MNHNPAAPDPDAVRAAVRDHYGAVPAASQSCCTPGSGCCGGGGDTLAASALALGYAEGDLDAVPDGSNLGLGCGNPHAIGSLQRGETVLDLGSGAGFDCFLAARAVGVTGRVIGVDMTPQMLSAARQNAAKGRFANVDFRLGEIEHLPVADDSVDVVMSNCVINLSPEKAQVFAEVFRVLRPGGRIAVSDVVALQELPADVRADLKLHAGCVAGAATVADLTALLQRAGFERVAIEPRLDLQRAVDSWFPGRGLAGLVASATIKAVKPAAA